jgi:NO-binding membrane sensor protein with MHYT domain
MPHALSGTYDLKLVAVSIVIAILAAYTALTFAGQVAAAEGRRRLGWLVGGAMVLGAGIWSMHFVGMLAFHLALPTTYDWRLVLVSLLAAIGASGLALQTVSNPDLQRQAWFNSSIWMGLGIGAMHYIGMAALVLPAAIHYDFRLVGLSLVVAILVSMVALFLVFRLRDQDVSTVQKLSSAIVMGSAIPVMHYIGMAAAQFEATGVAVRHTQMDWDWDVMSNMVCVITLMVLGLALLLVLEVRVKERTASLVASNQQLAATLKNLQQTQAQLIHNEKMSSLGEMLAGVAHEIKNPTSFTAGNVAYLTEYTQAALGLIASCEAEMAMLPPKTLAYLQEMDVAFLADDYPKVVSSIATGVNRINEIVLSLRNFAYLESGEMPMQSADLHQGIDGTLLILNHRLKSAQVQIVKAYADDFPAVTCYPGQLNQVFMNLLGNAIDVLETSDRAKTITVMTCCDAETIAITIADNGSGMAPAVQARLFEAFYTTKENGKGTGLGLSISHKIINETHHGQLTCTSTLGEGTAFHIRMPIKPSV